MTAVQLGVSLAIALVALGVLGYPAARVDAQSAPTVTGVSPLKGPITGGTNITLAGTNFAPTATVFINGTQATNVSVVSSTTITATTPPGLAGPGNIVVVNSGTSAVIAPGAYAYTNLQGVQPSILGVSPSTGDSAGGTLLTISGNDFLQGALVYVNGSLAVNSTWISQTQLRATTPGGFIGPVSVIVVNPDSGVGIMNSAFTFTSSTAPTATPQPGATPTTPSGALTVGGVTPNAGPSSGGTTVTVSGTGFATGAAVLFGVVPSPSVVVLSGTQLTAVAPANTVATGPQSVTVVNPGGVSGSLSAAYTYGLASAPLTVTNVSPNSGSINGGSIVTVTGTGLSNVSTVLFGGIVGTGLTVASDTRLTVTSPARSAGPVAVTVVTNAGSSVTLPNAFVYNTTTVLNLASVTPATGPTIGGTSITLSGAGFASGMTVTVGGVAATNVTVTGSSVATAVTPPRSSGAAGAVDVVISAGGQSATLQSAFTYTASANPTIALPTSGFGLFVFGGTNDQLVAASGCPAAKVAFWSTNPEGSFNVFVPGATVGAVNAAWNAQYPNGIPANTALIGRCSA